MFFVFLIGREKQDIIVESFGKYKRTVDAAGIHLKKPWETVADRISTAMHEFKEDLQTKTKDDIFVTLPIKMHLQVVDSKKFHYESRDPMKQVMSRVAATVKQLSSQMDFAELFQARETISHEVCEKVGKEISDLYGVKLVDVILDEPHAPAEIQASYNNVKASERNMLAAKNDAAAGKIRTIAEAEARREALRLDGEGIAAQRKAIFQNYAEQFNALASQGLTQEQAHEVIALAMSNDTIRDAASKGNVIITTTNSGDILSQMKAVGQSLQKPTSIKPPANDTGHRVQKPAHG